MARVAQITTVLRVVRLVIMFDQSHSQTENTLKLFFSQKQHENDIRSAYLVLIRTGTSLDHC